MAISFRLRRALICLRLRLWYSGTGRNAGPLQSDLIAISGNYVRFPPGEYTICSTLELADGQSLNGGGATLQWGGE